MKFNKEKETIDVVIPVYNGEKYILKAVESVIGQTHKPEKIIIVDDGSTDDTANLVRNYQDSQESSVKIEYVKKKNGGLSSARNAGLKKCEGKYVAFLDADDEWYEQKLEEQLSIFQKKDDDKLGVVFCEYIIIDDDGNSREDYFIFKPDPSLRGDIFEKLLEANKVAGSGSGVLIKRECFDQAGLFDEALSALEDWDMWLKIAKKYHFDYVPQKLVKIRRHEDNMQKDESRMFLNQILFYNKWAREIDNKKYYSTMVQWRNSICSQIISKLPNSDFLKIANNRLSKKAKKRLFSITFGSFKLFLWLSLTVVFSRNILTSMSIYLRGYYAILFKS